MQIVTSGNESQGSSRGGGNHSRFHAGSISTLIFGYTPRGSNTSDTNTTATRGIIGVHTEAYRSEHSAGGRISGSKSSTLIEMDTWDPGRLQVPWNFPYIWFGFGFGALPILIALSLCVTIALVYHKENTTATHCNVDNWLPSLSAAIGNNFPEIAIWRIGVSIMLLQRLIDVGIYYQLHKFTQPKSLQGGAQFHKRLLYNTLNVVRAIFALAEIGSLALLTYVSSTEHFSTHQIGFVGFVLAAFSSAFLQLALGYMKQQERLDGDLTGSPPFASAQSLKVYALMIQIVAAVCAAYTYVRHENRCEPGMYSLFAMCEYALVLSNIFFHFTLWWEIPNTLMGFTLDLPAIAVAPKYSIQAGQHLAECEPLRS